MGVVGLIGSQIVYFNQLSYFLSASFSKLCFLFMFLRIFPAERTRKLVYIGIGASVVFPIAFGVPLAFGCRPISGSYFTPLVTKGTAN
jgi:hypothetical protein